MKPRPFISPYMGSLDSSINASLTLAKLYKRIRTIDPTHKPGSRYQARLKHKRAERRAHLRIVK
ncbi:MAG: hypothetical protein EPN14_08000 [Gallionella sp.]|nr:MAG: hypothetical protein EPN14_08000 [Gallionella sp.]